MKLNMKLKQIIIIAFVLVLVLPIFALSQEIYKFEWMLPTLQQPWYFRVPTDAATDRDGFVYITDTGNNRVLKFTADGCFVANWRNDETGKRIFESPYGIAVDSLRQIYVTDLVHHVQIFTSDGLITKQWKCQDKTGETFIPYAIAIDHEGFVYLSDLQYKRIHKFTDDGKLVPWKENDIEEMQFLEPAGIAADKNGFLYVTDRLGHRVYKFTADGKSVEWKSGDIEEQGRFNEPFGIETDGKSVYVVERKNDRVQKFTVGGKFEGISWGEEGEGNGQFYAPAGIALSPNGELVYVVDLNNNGVQKFTSKGDFLAKWGSYGSEPGQFSRPMGVAMYGDFIYVADSHNDRIQKFTTDGKFKHKWGSNGKDKGQFDSPRGIASDSKGYVYVADMNNNRIQKFDSDGNFQEWKNPDIETHLCDPEDVGIDEDGYIYVADTGSHRILKFRPDGGSEGAWGEFGKDLGKFSSPSGVAIADGWLYVADTNNERIQRAKIADNLETWEKFSSGQFMSPTGIATDEDGSVYVTEPYNTSRIQKFSSAGDVVAVIGAEGQAAGQVKEPHYLCIGTDGRIYVGDSGNNRIQVFKPVDPEAGISKAVIIAGGGPYEGNHLWDATRMNANFAYRTLNYQGFGKNDICYLSSDTQVDLDSDNKADVYGKATVENLRQAVSDISDSSENVKDLVVYLVDHGGDGYFRMNEDAEMLYAYALNSELEKLQQKISGTMIIVYDACKSGSFINTLNPSGAEKRIVITSSQENEDAYFITQGSLSFSNLFWTHIFNGRSVQYAFNSVKDFYNKKSIKNQTPCMKDNTDEEEENIGNGANNHWEGPEISNPSYKNQFLQATVKDEDGVARVWAVIIPPDFTFGSASKAVLELPSVDLMPIDGSTGQYQAEYKGVNTDQIMIHAVDRIGNKAESKSVDVVLSNSLKNKAIVVADEENEKYVSSVLQYQGYKAEDIQKVEANALKTAIENISSNTNDVIIYLTGQGKYKEFQINDKETVTAADFGKQLDMLQSKIGGMIILIYDADYSGSFLPLVKPPTDKKRILISSSSASQKAYFSEGNISFSFFFWNSILQGITVREAFVNAKKSVRFLDEKIPQIDDNGNGIGNEDADSELAENTTIGAGIRVTMNDPFVKVPSEKPPLTGGCTEATIEADIFVTDNVKENEVKVWATVISPGYDADWLPVRREDPDTIELKPVGRGKYEVIYNGFSEFGRYKVAVYVKNNDNVSLYKEIFIDQTQGADIYESGEGDDDFAHATPIVINSPSPQHHNFYEKNDADWIKFYGRASDFYTIKIMKNTEAMIKVYDKDKASQTCKLISDDTDTKEWSLECKKNGFYYLEISNRRYGENTIYDIEIYTEEGGIDTAFLTSFVRDAVCNKIIKNAKIEVNAEDGSGSGSVDKINEKDEYSIFLVSGEYSVRITAPGYKDKTEEKIKIEADTDSGDEIKYLDIELEPLSRYHSADYDHNNEISLPELLRVIQLYNSGSYHCDSNGEDGYAPGDGDTCTIPHSSDYKPRDWKIDIHELLRVIQFYNTTDGYEIDCTGEDGFKPKTH